MFLIWGFHVSFPLLARENFQLFQKWKSFNSEMFLWGWSIVSQCSSGPEYIPRCIVPAEPHSIRSCRGSTTREFDQQRRVCIQVTRGKSNIFILRWNFFVRKYLYFILFIWRKYVFGEGGKMEDGVFCYWNFWCKEIAWATLTQELLHLPIFHGTWFGNLNVCLLFWSIRLLPFLWWHFAISPYVVGRAG